MKNTPSFAFPIFMMHASLLWPLFPAFGFPLRYLNDI